MSEQKDNQAEMNCPNCEKNLESCPCENENCPRRGHCCQCVANHRARNSRTACMK